MRPLLAIVLVALVSSCAPRGGAPPAGPPGETHLRVLATHDFHGSLRPVAHSWAGGRAVGGAAALKAVLDSAEARCGCPTVRLDGGDQMQGALESNLVYGASVVEAFNLMGLDAAAVGNHELDWGVDTLLARQRQAGYAWLSANVFRRDDGRRPPWARPYHVFERGGVKVAVIGYSTSTTPLSLRPATTAPYRFVRGVEGIRDVLEAVRREGPDFTAIVAHAGGDCRGSDCGGELVELARALPPGAVQLIVGGHDHESGEGAVNGIPIVRASSNARAVAVVDLYRRADGSRGFTVATDTVWVDRVDPDPRVTAMLDRYALRSDAIGAQPVATVGERLEAGPSLRLGNLIADAIRLHAGTDIGMHNPGGVRAELREGVATYADLFRILPFGNLIVKMSLQGSELREMVEHSLSRRPYPFSNLRVSWDPSAPAGRRIVSWALADGRPVLDEESYTLAVSDYLAEGGDGFAMLEALPHEPTGVDVLDAVIEHLDRLPAPVRAPGDDRLVAVRR